MPRSETPGVSWRLALSPPGLLSAGYGKPSAFPSRPLEDYPAVHDVPLFGAPSRGLPAHSPGSIHPLAGRHAGSLLPCWLGVDQGGLEPVEARTHWVTTTHFMGWHPIPRFWAYLGATSA
jgi:hypothetical protein